ncbi:MAG: LysM peptidoglycan-binding domain-containing protein [Planctomycetota bacterium]
MRAEVKLGIAVSAALVGVVGGYYFFFSGNGEATVPVNPPVATGTTGKTPEKANPAGKTAAADPKQNPKTKPASAQTAGSERDKQAARDRLADAAKGNSSNPTPAGQPTNTGQSILKSGTPGNDPRMNANPAVTGTPAQDQRTANAAVPNANRPTTGDSTTTPTVGVSGPDDSRRSTGPMIPATESKITAPGNSMSTAQNEAKPSPAVSDPSAAQTGNPLAPVSTPANEARGSTGQIPPSTPVTKPVASPTPSNPQVGAPRSDPQQGPANGGVTNPTGANPTGGVQPKSSLAASRAGADATKPPATSTPESSTVKGTDSSANPSTSKAAGKGSVETHRVQPGDTLASISQNYYGSEKHAKFLSTNNPDVRDASRLAVGTVIRIPSLPEDASNGKIAAARSTEPGKGANSSRTYRVKAGDTFYSIAKSELGESSRWKDLFALNKDAVNGDATQLRIGQILKLPAR